MLEHKTTSEIRRLARTILRFAPQIIAEKMLWNAENPDATPKDLEYQRVASYYAKKILRAHRAGKPVDPRWVHAICDGDALPEF
ncbi:MAG: hypothetical protein ACYC0Y_28685 [Pirellulales bacterium]